MIKEAANLGYIPAMYTLGLCYLTGNLTDENAYLAAQWFKKAALLGYPISKYTYGINLFYGSNGIEMDKELGLSFMQQAVDEGVEGAEYHLAKLKKEMQKNSSNTPEPSRV